MALENINRSILQVSIYVVDLKAQLGVTTVVPEVCDIKIEDAFYLVAPCIL